MENHPSHRYDLQPGERVHTTAPIVGSHRMRSSAAVEKSLTRHPGKYASVRRVPRINLATGETIDHEEAIIVKDL